MCKIFYPLAAGDFGAEWKSCVDQFLASPEPGYIPVKVNIFIDQPDYNSFTRSRLEILRYAEKLSGNQCPARSISSHFPSAPWKVQAEATYRLSGGLSFRSGNHKSIPYVVLESDGYMELWTGGVSGYSHPADISLAARESFELMNSILQKEGMSLNNLVRQWNYIGNILEYDDCLQNYQSFNEVRNEFYTRYRTVKGYPAATGVGMRHGGVILDFLAVKSGALETIAVQNPDQVNAYEYDQSVLEGPRLKGSIKHPPQFERALLVASGERRWLHVSGTASVIGQETAGKGDIEIQTRVAIDNIKKVSDISRLNTLVIGKKISDTKFILLRIYTRSQDFINTISRACDKYFPSVPRIFVGADICRNDLLMEIEAEAELL